MGSESSCKNSGLQKSALAVFDRALHPQIAALCPLQFVLLSFFPVLGNSLRPYCTEALPEGPPWTARPKSHKFLLASGVHHGVSEAKTMVVIPFDRETVPGGVGEACGLDKEE